MLAEAMMLSLSEAGVTTIGRALDIIGTWTLPTSHRDLDLSDECCRAWGVGTPAFGPPTSLPQRQRAASSSISAAPDPGRSPACFVQDCQASAPWKVTGARNGLRNTVNACLEHLVESLRAGFVVEASLREGD